MRVLGAALGLLLLGTLRAFPQDRPLETPCAGAPDHYHDKAAGRCCFRCSSGMSPTQPCPQGPTDCRKRCDPDYYLNEAGRCTACVSCLGDLVEKAPCSWNSSRVCECRPGMFCATSAAKSCARCFFHSTCPPGMVIKSPGTAEKDTVCELPSPGTGPNCTSPEACSVLTSKATPQAQPTLTSPATAHARTALPRGATRLVPEDAAGSMGAPKAPSSTGKSGPDPGPSPWQPCPQGAANCRKRCEPDYYLDGAGRCTACVSCSRDDLVEKSPCSWNSSRVCECRPGMFCATSAANSCARCIAHPICAPGTVLEPQGMAERDTTLEPPPPGTLPDCSTPENSKAPASATPTLSSQVDSQTSRPLPASIRPASSPGKPVLDPGPVFWVILVLLLVVGFGAFLLCHRRACRRHIGQKLRLCYPAQTFWPNLERADSRPMRSLTEPKRSHTATEPGTGELSAVSPPAVETCASVGSACPESLPLLDASPAGGPLAPRDPPEPRASTEHTNNRIEKIYIMKADTVIVGTVKTEVPEGWGSAGPVGPRLETELEVDHAPHCPEQETEPPLGSCRDIMFSVEEEGKEAKPETASGE